MIWCRQEQGLPFSRQDEHYTLSWSRWCGEDVGTLKAGVMGSYPAQSACTFFPRAGNMPSTEYIVFIICHVEQTFAIKQVIPPLQVNT